MSLVLSYLSWWVTAIKQRGRAEGKNGKVETVRDTFCHLLSITFICMVLFWLTSLLHTQSICIQSNEGIMSIFKTLFLPFLTLLKIQLEMHERPSCSHSVLSADQSGLQPAVRLSQFPFKWLDQSAPGGGSWEFTTKQWKAFHLKKTE